MSFSTSWAEGDTILCEASVSKAALTDGRRAFEKEIDIKTKINFGALFYHPGQGRGIHFEESEDTKHTEAI